MEWETWKFGIWLISGLGYSMVAEIKENFHWINPGKRATTIYSGIFGGSRADLGEFLTGEVLVPAAAGAAGASKIFSQNFKSLFGVEGLYWLLSCEEVAGLLLLFTVVVEVPIGFDIVPLLSRDILQS